MALPGVLRGHLRARLKTRALADFSEVGKLPFTLNKILSNGVSHKSQSSNEE